jgi:hypothetical protein
MGRICTPRRCLVSNEWGAVLCCVVCCVVVKGRRGCIIFLSDELNQKRGILFKISTQNLAGALMVGADLSNTNMREVVMSKVRARF